MTKKFNTAREYAPVRRLLVVDFYLITAHEQVSGLLFERLSLGDQLDEQFARV